MEQIEKFQEIKKLTSGYLNPEVYEMIYKMALSAPEGIAVDIGPAQGGSTISLASAIQDGAKVKKIYSIDVFRNSAALKSYSNVEENVDTLYKNLKHYGLEDKVTALVVGKDDTALEEETVPISVLFIDADGALDRDFGTFYNRLTGGAVIIIDDVENEINLQSKTRFLKWQTQNQVDCFLKMLGLPDLESYTPLGKQYTTYQFIQYLKENHFIEEYKMMDETLFAKKPVDAPVFTEEVIEDLRNIRKEIKNEYECRHQKLQAIYEKIASFGIQIGKLVNSDSMFLFENYDYTLKQRKQMVKVYEWHKENGDYLLDDLCLQDICFDTIEELVEPLIDGKVCEREIEQIKDDVIKTYLGELKYRLLKAYPIFIDNTFWGTVVCLFKEERNVEEKEEDVQSIVLHMIEVIKEEQHNIETITTL